MMGGEHLAKEIIQDKSAIRNVLGCLLLNPSILSETDKYHLTRDDFPERFHKIIFAAIENLYSQGIEVIDAVAIDTFLSKYELQYEIFNLNDGLNFIYEITELVEESNFDYYYQRLKKYSLLNHLQQQGIDVSEFYDPNILNPREQEKMQERLDEMTIQEIVDHYDKKLINLKEKFIVDGRVEGIQAGEGLRELIEELKENPERGRPLYSKLVSAVIRGARKRKYYIRSLPTGHGKTRLGVADILYISATKIYDKNKGEWLHNPYPEPSLIITTELEFEEIQTMALAFIAEVDEDDLLDNNLTEEEYKRIEIAENVLRESPIYFEYLPAFDADDIEHVIKKHVLNNEIQYCFFDYIHPNTKLLNSMSREAKVPLQEHQVLLMLSDRLKTICNETGIFLITSTQLNDNWKDERNQDTSSIRGSKAIIDKADVALLGVPVTKKDLERLEPILKKGFYPTPNMCFNLFKMRRGKYSNVKIFTQVNLGTLRTKDCFVTDQYYNPIPIEVMNTYIEIDGKELMF